MNYTSFDTNLLNEGLKQQQEDNKAIILNQIAAIQVILNSTEVMTSNKEKAFEIWNEIQMCLRFQLNIDKAEFDEACKFHEAKEDCYNDIYDMVTALESFVRRSMIFSFSEQIQLHHFIILMFRFKVFLHDSCSRD
jgi:hypothetical protein